MRKKHFIALFLVFLLLVISNLSGLFSFLNNWGFDELVKLGPKRSVSPEIIAIRVQPHDDLNALIDHAQQLEYKSLSLLMLNSSGTLTSHIFSADGDALQFKSIVQPPDSLTWRGPEEVSILKHKLEAICQTNVSISKNCYLDFAAGAKHIPKLEAHQVVSGEIPAEFFSNKIVIIGDHFASQTRFYSSPIHQGDQSLTALSKEILLVDAALNDSWVTLWPNSLAFTLAIMVVAGLIIGFKLHPLMKFKSLILALVIAVCLLSFVLLKAFGIWFPPASLLFAISASGLILYLAAYREWTQTLHKLVLNLEQQSTVLLAYGPKGLVKYHSAATERLLVERDICPKETSLNSILETFTDLDQKAIQSLVENITIKRQSFKQLISIDSENYQLSIQPLGSTDSLVVIDQPKTNVAPHHQEPTTTKQDKEISKSY